MLALAASITSRRRVSSVTGSMATQASLVESGDQ